MKLGFALVLVSSVSFAQSHHPQDFLRSIAGAPDEGEQVVEHFCGTCHGVDPLIQLGAPTIGDSKAWEMRKKQGMSVLFEHTAKGLRAMPPRGGCFECSDETLKKAIEVLVREKT